MGDRSGATAVAGVVGVVLCGGASRRMGRDKALLGPPGRPLAGRVADAVAATGVVEVLLVGGDGRALGGLGTGWLADDRPGEGPLAGAATVAAARPGSGLLVCACDLPWVTAEDLVPLLDAVARGAPAAVAVVDGREQWSAIAVSARVAAAFPVAVERGERALRRVIPGDVARLDADRPGRLRDVDRPEDLPPGLWGDGAAGRDG